MENIFPQEGLEKLEKLGTKESSKKGQPYYSLILSKDLHSYIKINGNFNLKKEIPETNKKEKKAEVISNQKVKEVEKRVPPEDKVFEKTDSNSIEYKPKLVREVRGEKPLKPFLI